MSTHISLRHPAVTVLFSGGRDSSLAAGVFASYGNRVNLVTCDNGATLHGDIAAYRVAELRRVFPDSIGDWVIRPTYALFRTIALKSIEDDFARYKVNLILLGSQLASLSEGILYCIQHEISCLASGFTAYQAHFAEQTPTAVAAFSSFCSEFDIEFATPVIDYQSPEDVRDKLLEFGISTKSLEGFSIFSDTFSDPTPEQVQDYLNDKLPRCRDFIHSASQTQTLRGIPR